MNKKIIILNRMSINTNQLLPFDTEAGGSNVISIANLGKTEALNRLLQQGYLPYLILLTRKIFANVELFGRGKVVAPANISYNCELKTNGTNQLLINNQRQVLSEIFNQSSQFGQLINLIFRAGQREFLRGKYRQYGKPVCNIPL